MNKNVKLFLSALMCILLLVSCKPVSDCGKVYGSKEVYGKATLSIGIDEVIPTGARTILPDTWTDARSQALTYKLTGSKTQNSATNEVTGQNGFTYAQISGGTAKINLDPAVWYLTLTAYQGDEVALVSPECMVDLTGGSASYTFALAAERNTNATGELKVDVTFTKPSNFYRVVYGLYPTGAQDATAVTGIKTGETEPSGLSYELQLAGLTTVNSTNGTYKFGLDVSAVKAGNYYFNANFIDAEGRTFAYYTEKVTIDGGNISQKAFTLPDIFEKPPVNPTNFAVTYAYNDNALNCVELAAGASAPDSYKATFTWTDNSDNETGFELILTDGNGDEVDLDAEGVIVDGSLSASSTTVTINLSTGVVYEATLRAINRYAPSFENDGTKQSLDDINLFTVTYDLNGGVVQTGNSTATAETTVKYVKPFAGAVPHTLLSGSNASFPYVKKTNYEFVEWRTNVADAATVYAALPDANTGNVAITAYWHSILNVGASLPNYNSLPVNLIQETHSTVTEFPADSGSASITLTAIEGIENVSFALKNNATETAITEHVTITPAAGETLAQFTWSFGTVEAGTYRLEIEATKDDFPLSNVLYFKITR